MSDPCRERGQHREWGRTSQSGDVKWERMCTVGALIAWRLFYRSSDWLFLDGTFPPLDAARNRDMERISCYNDSLLRQEP